MDKNELILECKNFATACAEKGFKLDYLKLIEAYPGASNTSYTMCVTGAWMKDLDQYEIIHALSGIMWEVMSQKAREKVFSIKILDSQKNLSIEPEEFLLINEMRA